MKKILLVCTVFMFALAGNVSAQQGKELTIESFSWGATNATGPQSVVIPNGGGTLNFDLTGDGVGDVILFLPGSLKSHRALLVTTIPKPEMKATCKYPLKNGYFATADKKIGICFCKPTPSSTTYTITIARPNK